MRKLVIGLAAFVFLATLPVFAQGMSMAYVDVLEVFNKYKKTEEYDGMLEKKKAIKEKELEQQKNDIEKLRTELKMLKEAEKKAKQGELEAKIDQYNTSLRGIALDLKKERDERMRDILDDIQKSIEAYAKENKISLIFREGAIAFGDKSMDKTEDIIRIINTKYKPSKK